LRLALGFSLALLAGCDAQEDVLWRRLIAHWQFNEGAGGTASDSSGNENTGALVGGPSWAPGHREGALAFDGGSDAVVVPGGGLLDDLRSFTYPAWINPRSAGAGGFGVIANKGASAGAGSKRLLVNSGEYCSGGNCLELTINRESQAASALGLAGTVTLDVWQHVAATYSTSDGPRLYMDGAEVFYIYRDPGAGPEDEDQPTPSSSAAGRTGSAGSTASSTTSACTATRWRRPR
jgi:Concanavalin A-like lectin/glucanases superfamily